MEQKVGDALVARAELDGCLQQEGQVCHILRMVSTHKVTGTNSPDNSEVSFSFR